MGAVRFAGIVFIARPLDHTPPHVHAITGSGEVIIELLGNGSVRLDLRKDAVRGAKTSDVRRVLKAANSIHARLVKLWEDAH